MAQNHSFIFNKRTFVLLGLIALFFAAVINVAFGAATAVLQSGDAVYSGGSWYVKVQKTDGTIIGHKNLRLEWKTKPATFAKSREVSNACNASLSGGSGSMNLAASSYSTKKTMSRSSSTYIGDDFSYSKDYYIYIQPAVSVTIPPGYLYSSYSMDEPSNVSLASTVGIPKSFTSASSSGRTCTIQIYANSATFTLKTDGKYKHSGYGTTIKFRPTKLTINYNTNGGTVSASGYGTSGSTVTKAGATGFHTANYDAEANLYNTTTFGLYKRGYHLIRGKEWNTAASGTGTSFDQDADYKAQVINTSLASGDKTTTLYANWQPNKGKIAFDANGGDGYMEDQEYEVGAGSNLNRNLFENEGYRFTGWNTKRDGSGISFGDEQGIKNAFVIGDGDTIELYAQWEPKGIMIHYDGNGQSDGRMDDQPAELGREFSLAKNEYSKNGSVFQNWNADAGFAYGDAEQIRINSNLLNGTDDLDMDDEGSWQKGTFKYESGSPGYIIQAGVPVRAGKTYTMSCRAKGGGVLYLRCEGGGVHEHAVRVDSEEWKLCSFTFTPQQTSGYNENIADVYFGSNSRDEAGGLKISGMKLEEGDTATQYVSKTSREITLYAQWIKGRFSIEGDTSVSGYQFRRLHTENGILHIDTKLSDNKFFSVFGLDDGSVYQTGEGGSRNYSPAYEVTLGKEFENTKNDSADSGMALSTPEEKLSGNMEYTFTNTRKTGGKDLTVRKKVTGDLAEPHDKDAPFTFSYSITGLDPRDVYTIVTDHSGEKTETAAAPVTALTPADHGYEQSGSISGEISIKHDDFFTIEDLPEGAKYNITEKTNVFSPSGWPYRSSYEVTEGAWDDNGDPLVDSVSSHGITSLGGGANSVYGLSVNQNGEQNEDGLGVETMHDKSVEYLFRNARAGYHALTIRKQVKVDDESDRDPDEEFAINVNFSNLEPDTLYTATDAASSFVSGEDGKAEVSIRLKSSQQITFNNIPGDAEYEVSEAGSDFSANVKVITAGNVIYETTGMYRQGVSVSNLEDRNQGDTENEPAEEVGLDDDQTILFTNSRKTSSDLTINKETAGKGAAPDDEFSFSVHFRGLDVKDYEVEKVMKDEDGEVLAGMASVFRPGSEDAVYQFTLRSNETIIIKNIPSAAAYTITESGSEGYTPSYTFDSGQADTASGAVKEGASLSTEEEELPVDAEITFTNSKDTPPPEKTVSDDDGMTWEGSGPETDVKENTVPGRDSGWSYKVTQRVYPGYEKFIFEDDLPANVIFSSAAEKAAHGDECDPDLPEDISIRWIKNDGTILNEEIFEDQDDDEDDDGDEDDDEEDDDADEGNGKGRYKSEHFKIFAQAGSVIVRSADGSLIGEGGEFEIVMRVKVDPASEKEDFRDAGQLYRINERLLFKNYATVKLGDNEYRSNLVRTSIPAGEALVIGKNVTGDLGDLTKEFRFTLDMSGLEPSKHYSYDNPAYIRISAGCDENEGFCFEARNELADPVQGVKIKLYSVTDEAITDEQTGQETEGGHTELCAVRTTDSDGKAYARLKSGEYRYEYTYDGETVCGAFYIGSGDDPDPGAAEGIEEVFMPRNDYGDDKYFLTDEHGNAQIVFHLKDDEVISFSGLPEGVKYRITEAASNHIPSYAAVRGADALEEPEKALDEKEEKITTPVESLTGPVEYRFTNHRELEPVTGGKAVMAGILLLAAAILISALSRLRKARPGQAV